MSLASDSSPSSLAVAPVATIKVSQVQIFFAGDNLKRSLL